MSFSRENKEWTTSNEMIADIDDERASQCVRGWFGDVSLGLSEICIMDRSIHEADRGYTSRPVLL